MRYFIELQYKGANYHGWQIQPNAITVQEILEKRLSTLLKQNINIVGAGRTDTGVHASYYVAHFNTNIAIEIPQFLYKWNRFLPQDIHLFSLQKVAPETHARFSAIKREYHYFISLRKNPFNQDFSYQIHQIPDIQLMNRAAKFLLSTQDFTSFSKLNTQVANNFCELYEAEFLQKNSLLIFKISANRFLRNMVRAIVGTLLEIGNNKISIPQFKEIIESKNRSKAGFSVPGKALFLSDIIYPNDLFVSKITKNKLLF